MIHLVNGGSTLESLKQTSIPGDKFTADDILMEGPVVDNLRSESSWNFRAEYLDRCFSISAADYLSGKSERDRVLAEALNHDEIVLWFEFDLFCQANLLYLLDWFASSGLGRTRLSLICPEAFPGRDQFRGLGELTPTQLESLFPHRTPVTPEQFSVAQRGWHAYGSDDPGSIEQFLQSDFASLPLLGTALEAHLQRFPSVENGLGMVAQKTLEILLLESLAFSELFPRVSAAPEIFLHGMGDLQLKRYLKTWASAPSPLIRSNGAFHITDTGRRVLENRDDAVRLNGIDIWYGGTHLTLENQWRWDSTRDRLVFSTPH